MEILRAVASILLRPVGGSRRPGGYLPPLGGFLAASDLPFSEATRQTGDGTGFGRVAFDGGFGGR